MSDASKKPALNSFTLSGTLPSSNIRAYAYREDGKALLLRFSKGDVYLYTGVPRSEVLGLIGAESAGKYFQEHIRDNAAYQFLRMPGDDLKPEQETEASAS